MINLTKTQALSEIWGKKLFPRFSETLNFQQLLTSKRRFPFFNSFM